MTIQKLTLKNFRNFENLSLEFSPHQTLIVGANGRGKSNILEAIYLLASGLSSRADREEEMIKWGREFAKIQAQTGDESNLDLTLSLSPDGRLAKTAQLNAVKKPFRQFIQNLYAVSFSPGDLDLVSGSPEPRRRFLNGVLCQVDANYRQNLHDFEKARHEKNSLLEKVQLGLSKEKDLEVWNDQILILGKKVQEGRESFLKFLSENDRGINFEYRPSLISAERLSQFLPREIGAGTSLIGPHRDDWSVVTEGHNLAHFGSRGEQRMAIFTLKNRELDYFRQRLKTEPILLLDDIFSELDAAHRGEVLNYFKVKEETQVVFTATGTDLLDPKQLDEIKVIKL